MSQKTGLKPISQNIWYVMMTIYGEPNDLFDDVHKQNRRIWNAWATGPLHSEKLNSLIRSGDVSEHEIGPLSTDERLMIERAIRERIGSDVNLPRADKKIDFSHTHTEDKRLYCRGFIFNNVADFRYSDFMHFVDFDQALFISDALFSDSTFRGNVTFRGAKFLSHVEYFNTCFHKGLYFEKADFYDYAIFTESKFHWNAIFNDTTFRTGMVFDRAIFLEEPATFFGAALHEDTSLIDVEWPPTPTDPDKAKEIIRYYERLKLLMDSQRKFPDEHLFLRKELACREVADGFPRNIPSRLFRLVSNYGWSIERPSAALAITLIAGWWLMYLAEWVNHWLSGAPKYLGWWQSLGLSGSNLFGFLGLNRTYYRDVVPELTALSQFVGGLQTIFGAILLFFLALGLRNRFRMK